MSNFKLPMKSLNGSWKEMYTIVEPAPAHH